MITRIIYFGMLAEKLGKGQENINFSDCDEKNLRKYFEKRYPVLKEVNFKIAIDKKIGEDIQNNMSEIALLPPFAGG